MKKVLFLAFAAILAIAAVMPVLASDNAEQVAKAYAEKLEAQKAYIDALAADGKITQEQADLIKKNIDVRIEYVNSDKFDASTTYAPGAWGARRGGRFGASMGRFGGRMMNGGFCGACPWITAPTPVPAPAQ